MTFIRNEVRNTSIHYKNELFVTNLDTNFWLIMIIVKVTNGGIYHECKKGHSQSADNSQLLAHKSSPQGGHAFKLKAPYKPTGDQPQAIAELVKGFKEGNQCQTLLGVTGSGKTFTMANVIQQLQKPTLVIAHNKTLAAQLYGEFKEMFPDNAVEYFVS